MASNTTPYASRVTFAKLSLRVSAWRTTLATPPNSRQVQDASPSEFAWFTLRSWGPIAEKSYSRRVIPAKNFSCADRQSTMKRPS